MRKRKHKLFFRTYRLWIIERLSLLQNYKETFSFLNLVFYGFLKKNYISDFGIILMNGGDIVLTIIFLVCLPSCLSTIYWIICLFLTDLKYFLIIYEMSRPVWVFSWSNFLFHCPTYLFMHWYCMILIIEAL